MLLYPLILTDETVSTFLICPLLEVLPPSHLLNQLNDLFASTFLAKCIIVHFQVIPQEDGSFSDS